MDLQSLTRGSLELRLRRTVAQAMADGDWGKELEARQLLAQLLSPTDYQAQAAQDMGALEGGAVAAGAELDRLGTGAQRLAGRALGDEAMVAASRAADAERKAAMAPVEQAHPIATTVGNMVPGMAVPGGVGNTLLGRALGAAGAGIGYEWLGSGGDIGMGDAAKIGALSAAGSAAGDMAGRALAGHPAARVLGRPSREHADMVARADALGYGLTPADRLNARNLRKLEAGWERNPFMGAAFDALREGNQDLANQIGARAIGAPDARLLTDTVLESAHRRIGREMRRAAGQGGIDLGDDFVDALADIERRHATVFADTDGQKIRTMLNKALDRAANRGTIDVDEYLLQTSELARLSRRSIESPDVARAAHELREALDDAFDASQIGSLPDLQAAKGQYRALRELEAPGVVKQGNVSLPTLHNKLERLQRGRVAGLRDLDEAARVGHHFGQQVPDSGTPTGLAMARMRSPMEYLRDRIAETAGGAYLSRAGRALVTQPGLLGLPMSLTGLTGPVAEGLLNAVPTLTQRAGRVWGTEEATRPAAFGLPLF